MNELKESTSIDPTLLAEILGRFPLEPQPTKGRSDGRGRPDAKLPLPEKVRLVVELQRLCLPLLERRRPLAPWERPWQIEPQHRGWPEVRSIL